MQLTITHTQFAYTQQIQTHTHTCARALQVFVTHGGLSSEDDVKLSQIRQLKRGSEPPEGGLFSDLLWSDPQVR